MITTKFKVGELYVFTDPQTTNCIWGIVEKVDSEERILLEAATADFKTFRLHISLPSTYTQAKPASRNELRDFSYNLGYRHI